MDPSYPHQFPKSGQILYGADYNPDQWLDSPEVLEDDIRLMKHLGVTSASIGIFSWTSLEPEEGVFCFDWLDATMERFERAGLTAFLATPSASKPNWLAQQHPEICRVDQDGKRAPLGGRHNHCPTSPIYRQYVRRINHELAKRYAGHPALGLWHIGNEFSGECHCELCRKAFQEWLKARYGTLEALNDAWWTAFWNSTFTAWEQIPTSDKAIDGLGVDWRRFMNDQHVSFLENEMAPLRELTPQIPCTTNLMGTNASTNYWQWSKSIDIISNDLYPLPDDRADGGRRGLHSDFTHSLMRGLSGGKPWILMECSPSSVNWSTVNKLKRPGVHMQEVLQAVANGADAVHYFQWRKSRGGFEKYHGAVVDHAGAEGTRVFGECEEIGRILGTLSPISGHSSPRAEVAMVYDWESRWALGASIGPKPTQEGGDGYSQACRDHFRALRRAGLEVDIISVEGDFSKYKLVVTPALYALSEATAQRLTDFAEAGGTWVTTYFTGYVDPTNRCWRGGFPGPQLRKVFGLWNEEVDYLFDDEKVLIKGAVCGPTGTTEGVHIVEHLHAEGAEVLATAESQFYAGAPLILRNACGKGSVYYLGARIADEGCTAFYQSLVETHALNSISLPEGVFRKLRPSSQGTVEFLFNYLRNEVSVDLGEATYFRASDQIACTGKVMMRPYETLISGIHCGPSVSTKTPKSHVSSLHQTSEKPLSVHTH